MPHLPLCQTMYPTPEQVVQRLVLRPKHAEQRTKFGSPKTFRLVAILPEPPQAPQAQDPLAWHRWHRRLIGSGGRFL